MTKEENITTLNEHLTHWKRLLSEKICDQSEGEKTIDALQNAIKALEQQPTDAVDRLTIKEYLESFGTAYELGKEKGLDIALDILDKYTEEGNEKIIRDLPSETPQPEVGRWIYDKNIDNWKCSECGETPKTMGYCGAAAFMAKHFKYCNHCGTKMGEVEE
jgi:hypothetical protein